MAENDLDHLLNDLDVELHYPVAFKGLLVRNQSFRLLVENLVHALIANRTGSKGLCTATASTLLYKYCRHRDDMACHLQVDDCRFKSPAITQGDKDLLDVSPCPDCHGIRIHQEWCRRLKVIWPCGDCGGEIEHTKLCATHPGEAF